MEWRSSYLTSAARGGWEQIMTGLFANAVMGCLINMYNIYCLFVAIDIMSNPDLPVSNRVGIVYDFIDYADNALFFSPVFTERGCRDIILSM